jgi:sortase A
VAEDRRDDRGFTSTELPADATQPMVLQPPATTPTSPVPGTPGAAGQSGTVNVWDIAPTPRRRFGRRQRTPAMPAVAPAPQATATKPASDGEGERRVVWVGLTALTLGLCLVLFVGYVYVFSGFPQARHQISLVQVFHTRAAEKSLHGIVPSDGTPVGVLQIPAIHLQQVFVQGTTATDLMLGPGVMPGTARPGTAGNSVIAGRRVVAGGPFADIGSLHNGDHIIVTTGLGRFDYRVTGVGTTSIGSPDPISDTRQARLTLVTSNPAFVPTGRLYVTAALHGHPVTGPGTALPRHPPTASDRALSGDAAAVWPSVLWGLALVAVLGASIWAYQRRRDHVATVYLLTTPIVLAVALMWYSNLIRLLPATM